MVRWHIGSQRVESRNKIRSARKAARAQAGQPQGVAPTMNIPSPLGGEGQSLPRP